MNVGIDFGQNFMLADIRRRSRVETYFPGRDIGRLCTSNARGGQRVVCRFFAQNVSSSTDFARHETTFVGQSIGTTDCADCHLQVECEIALWRKFDTRWQSTIPDGFFDGIGKLQVKWTGFTGKIWESNLSW